MHPQAEQAECRGIKPELVHTLRVISLNGGIKGFIPSAGNASHSVEAIRMGTTEDGHTVESPAPLADQIGASSNTLLCGPATSDVDAEACRTLFTPPSEADQNVLHVEFSRSLDECRAVWEETSQEPSQPTRLKILKVGEMMRSAATQDTSVSTEPSDSLIETVRGPDDLTSLGIAITRILDSWQETADQSQTVVCFHSVTALLDHVDCYPAFRFLHVLTSRIDRVGAVAHYHLHPTAHDDETVMTIMQLFDTIVEFDDDGDWTVRTQ